ncbi:predicted protein [Botrytis cinerea T4]|uniref:Uncharacterized protein n=1 Tax=Botryotinia fuckeliana (strain T4) TaxID=999810 RepID=G2YB48_BOTF4|nr:predicted protein [Botrytis cinerea T4]
MQKLSPITKSSTNSRIKYPVFNFGFVRITFINRLPTPLDNSLCPGNE